MFLSHLNRLAGLTGALAGLCFVLTLAGSSAYAQGRGSAHLTIKRTSDQMYQYSSAAVAVNGAEVTKVSWASAVTVAIPAGQVTVSVSGFGHPGSSSVVINARPGGRYAIEVSPRTESLVVGAMFGLAGTIVDATVNSKTSGLFKIRVTRP